DGADTFYRGRLARRLAAHLEAAGTLVSTRDLEAFEAEQQEPIGIDYRGFTVLEAPPNSTGFVLLEELKILENFDLARMGLLSTDAVHIMVEAKKLAFADRERWPPIHARSLRRSENCCRQSMPHGLPPASTCGMPNQPEGSPRPRATRPISAPP